jgi:hypothetical protein
VIAAPRFDALIRHQANMADAATVELCHPLAHLEAMRHFSPSEGLVRIDAENNLILVHGAVPGPIGGYVMIKETNKL